MKHNARILLTGFMAAVLVACGGGSNTGGTSSSQPIVIGMAVAQTGGFSAYDLGIIAAAKIEIANLNSHGGVLGRQLQVAIADTKSDRAQGPQAALTVLGQGANLVITQCDFDFGSPAALVALQHNVPAFSCASSPKFGVQDIGPLAFSINFAGNEEAAVAAEYPYKKLGFKTVYILTDPTIAYSKDLGTNFKQVWTGLAGAGSVLGTDTFQNGDPSIDAQITRIKSLSTKPDFIFLSTYLPGGVSAIRQIRAAGLNTPIMTGQAMDDSSWLNAVPNLSDFYAVDYASFYGDDSRSDVNSFFANFQQVTGSAAPNAYPIMGYSMVQLFALAVQKAGSTDGKAVSKALESGSTFNLLVGPTVFSPDLHINDKRPMTIMTIKNGKAAFVTQYTPESVPAPIF
jgi:branched-chain amino acid transport system substrate-binding protein